MIGARSLAGVIGVALAVTDGAAQTRAFLDVGSGNARFDNFPGSTFYSVAPSAQLIRPSWSAAAAGTYSVFDRGGWSGQGFAALSLFTPGWRALRGEVSGRGEASTRSTGLGTGQAVGVARIHLVGHEAGAWLGGTAGSAWRGRSRETVLRGDLGVWTRLGTARLAAWLTRAVVHDSTLVQNVSDEALAALVQPFQSGFTEAAAAMEWAERPFELAGAVAQRFGRASYRATSWSASGTWWFASRLGLMGGAGRYPPDLAQAHPGGRYVSAALRVALRSTRPVPPVAAGERVSGARVRMLGVEAGRFVLVLRANAARLVEVAGDFTDWQPVALIEGPKGWWSLMTPLAPGTYRLNVRLDGGAWQVPADLAAERDDFSGLVGILIVGG